MKNNLIFPIFKDELKNHDANGYHLMTPIMGDVVDSYYNEEYLLFLKSIGPGIFYAGSLQIFSPNDKRLEQLNSEFDESISNQFLAIGYDGTTEGCFALNKNKDDNGIYYINRKQPNDVTKLSKSFYEWIENTPNVYYDPRLYKGFGKIKDLDKIREVISDRKVVKVKLSSYTKDLIAKPDAEKKYLKRYNKLIFEVELSRPISLQELTVKMFRTGSSVGDDNIEYVTLNIDRNRHNQNVEAYLFDPFNVPFNEIVCLYNPEINLNSRMRLKYKEILPFL